MSFSSLVRELFRHVLPKVLKPLRSLWNEIIGFVFLAFALVPVPRAVQAWKEFNQSGEGLFKLALSGVFILIMAGFGISSFLRARKISRS